MNKLINKQLKLNTVFTKEASTDDESITISGFANTTTVDRVGDIIAAEAWLKGGLDNYNKNPIILAFHNYEKPIGRAEEIKASDKGLFIKAKISSAAGPIFKLIKDNIVTTFSVGFIVKDADYDSATEIFVIKDLELLEISVVSVPANADSTFSVTKQLGVDIMSIKEDTKDGKEAENSENKSVNNNQELADKLDNLTNLVAKMGEKQVAVEDKDKDTKAQVTLDSIEKLEQALAEKVLKRLEDEAAKKKEVEDAEAAKQAKLTLEKLVGDLQAEVKEKADELLALRNNKMSFGSSNQDSAISLAEKEAAVMLSTILQKDISDTKYGKTLLEKAGSDNNVHIPSTLWEREFFLRAFDDLRQRLVVSPLFSSVQMNALNLTIPINPDPAANATWVARTNYGTANSSGSAVTTALSEVTMKAHKLAAHEYLIDEEEEDAIIAVAPIIRDSMLRRMGRTWDKALLRGANNEGGGDPINGIVTSADTANLEVTMGGTLATEKVTVAYLQSVRRQLGIWGLDPMDVKYIVSTDAYYDLLDDPDFRTMDLVGVNATILKGQIGQVNGSPVIVSGEFAAKGASAVPVVAVNPTAFLVGELRNLRFERDREVLNQRELLVASTRVGFINLITGQGSAILKYPAA